MTPPQSDQLHNSIPLPDIGRRWMEEARELHLTDPAASVLLEHCGAMDHQTMTELVMAVERSRQMTGEPAAVRKRVINVLIEALDNMQRHAMGLLRDASCAMLVHDAKGYLLATGNAVPPATATLLTHRMGILNQMDPQDLREHFLKLLANNSRTQEGGSGLGLLAIARRSARPMVARTSSLGPYTAFLSFEWRVEGEEGSPEAMA